MAIRLGDYVHVAQLGKGIVREVRNGRYLVEIKGKAMLVGERQVSAVDPVKPPVQVASTTGADPQPRGHAAASIDLHGMTTIEAVAALDLFVNDAILGGLAEVRIIHGRSGGRVKSAVHARLRVLGVVRGFRLEPGNPGVTVVAL